MNSKVVAGILAIVAIGLAGVVFYQQNELNEARQEIARLGAEIYFALRGFLHQ